MYRQTDGWTDRQYSREINKRILKIEVTINYLLDKCDLYKYDDILFKNSHLSNPIKLFNF